MSEPKLRVDWGVEYPSGHVENYGERDSSARSCVEDLRRLGHDVKLVSRQVQMTAWYPGG